MINCVIEHIFGLDLFFLLRELLRLERCYYMNIVKKELFLSMLTK